MTGFIITLLLVIIGYIAGSTIERRHYRKIVYAERASRNLTTTNLESIPRDEEVERCQLVTGNAVISLDYFKSFVAGLKTLFGGNLGTYEPLLDRARRTALLRMRLKARHLGYHAVINVRLETSQVASSLDDNSPAGVEVLAYGTAIAYKGGNKVIE